MGDLEKKSTGFSEVANTVMRFAEQIKNAGEFIPQSFRGNAGAIAAAILTGRELGLEPMASLRSLYVVKGKVGISYDAIVGLLRGHGYGVEWPETNSEIATIRLTHKDKSLEPMVMSYTKEDAVKAGLWGTNTWAKHPATMLRARCVSNAARAFAGEILAGVYTNDEIEEIEEKPINDFVTKKNESGVDAAIRKLGVSEENVTDKMVITEKDLLLDEIEAANTIEELDMCAEKIKSKISISETDKGSLRVYYTRARIRLQKKEGGT